MIKRIAGIVFIFLCTTVAWGILGATVFSRTESSDTRLQERVISTWGAPHEQLAPSATYTESQSLRPPDESETVQRIVEVPLPLVKSRVKVALDLEYRKKGLLWYSTYKVDFAGTYVFQNPTAQEKQVSFALTLPATQALYDGLVLRLDNQPLPVVHEKSVVRGGASIPAGQSATLEVSYRSHGLDNWRYNFGEEVTQVSDFSLLLTTNFKEIDFPEDTLSPTEKRETEAGWELAWRYDNLISGYQIGVALPQRLQPGPLAGRISFFAPVSLFFFFFLLFVITTLRNIDLHPMNYFFLACAFFSFHLLLAYLADHISIHVAFAVCSAVSILLVVSYLRLVVGLRFALLEAGMIQFVYLVLFSYTFFLEGYTGLTVTIGSIVTLFVVMQMTAHVRWGEKFA